MSKAIEFKAGALTAMTAIVRELDSARLTKVIESLLGGADERFSGEATIIDLGQLKTAPEAVDWNELAGLLRRYGLQPVALKNAPEALQDSARNAGFAVLEKTVARAETAEAKADAKPQAEAKPEPPAVATRVIDRPVRSGQQIYAPGGDLILLGGVSPGAEVIADGSIHCYGPLRGRALAGARGNTAARIFASNFGPDLVSIAGVYRTFEGGIAAAYAGKPTQVLLKAQGDQHILTIETLQLD